MLTCSSENIYVYMYPRVSSCLRIEFLRPRFLDQYAVVEDPDYFSLFLETVLDLEVLCLTLISDPGIFFSPGKVQIIPWRTIGSSGSIANLEVSEFYASAFCSLWSTSIVMVYGSYLIT